MILQSFRHLWGVYVPVSQFIPTVRGAGYTGIETGLNSPKDLGELSELITGHDLQLIAQVYSSGPDVAAHLDSLRKQVEKAAAFTPRPVMINSHSGSDRFTLAQAVEYFRGALEIEREFGIRIAHETHRGRILFTPWVTSAILREVPELKLVADFSHWVCVGERLLQDCEEDLQLAAAHTLHVHCRVGQEHAPQVSEPRAPEYARHLAAHEAWWDMIWASQRARGQEISTFTPEFGPPGYMPTLPYTRQSVGNLAEICDWMAERQLGRFSK